MSAGRWACIACVGAAGVLVLAGCESSQSKSAQLRSEARSSAPEKGLRIVRDNPDVRITASTVLTDVKAKRSAAVITLHNMSRRAFSALPLLFTVTDAAGKQLFTNASPGASRDLTTVPSLPPGATLEWVDNAIVNVTGATAAAAKVGVGKAAAGRTPRLRISRVRLETDPIDGITAVGKVFNDSKVPQERLVVFAVARRGGKIVAAGRAVVPTVRPGPKGASFTIFFVGSPRGAKLSVSAPPVSFGAVR